MQQEFVSLEERKRDSVKWRDRAQARLEALGDKATFADEMVVVCAQSQVDYLESLNDEPMTFAEANEPSSPHLTQSLQKDSTHATRENSAKPATIDVETEPHATL